MDNKTDLILKITAKQNVPISYAQTFKCDILEVMNGNIEMDTFFLTVLVGDKNELLISERLSSDGFEVGFRKLKENMPYSLAPITGFVDSNKTAWEIVYIK